MLYITIPSEELYDESTNTFHQLKEQTLKLEHSLVSLHKWESKWHKPFLATTNKSGQKEEHDAEEILDYIRCMTITQNVDPSVYGRLTAENIQDINDYIENTMTATTFPDDKKKKGKQRIVTAELIYYWMFSLQIPIEWEKRHLNQLLTLIRVFNVENEASSGKKKSSAEIMRNNRELNEQRRKLLNSKG